ncbi:MAG: hypothetical protein R3293_26090 [Candidatus Promineifilaceae bacterium]|nr:hypothetical protein [Candidatus Promineifilaceae bacterium]
MKPLSRVHAAHHLSDQILDRPLALAAHFIAGFHAFARQFAELGDIDLPPVVQPAASRGHLQTTATLYLAAELEAALLITAVETLAGLFASGAVHIEGEGGRLLYRFWQQRHEHFSRQERQAIFAGLFGHLSDSRLAMTNSRNRDFPTLMFALAEAVVSSQADILSGRRPASDVAVAIAANRLALNLVNRSGGITGFAAADLLALIKEALAILKLRPVQAALGAISVWTAVQAIANHYLGEAVNVGAHVQRGKSGMLLLTWVAEILPQLDAVSAGGRLSPPTEPVYNAAVTWLQATLDLQDSLSSRQQSVGLPFPFTAALVPGRG